MSLDPRFRSPGQHARSTVKRLRMRTLVILGVLAVATTLLGRRFGLHDARFLGSEIALLAAMFIVSRFVLPLVDRHDRGAKGEEQVGGLLQTMSGDGWLFIHDVSFGHGNVDHIAIGPGGVFTIETKSHPGPVKVGRIHGATLRQAQSQQKLIAELTGEAVEPLIVFSRAWVDRPLTRRKGVRVLPARMLVGYLSQRKSVLGAEQIDNAAGQITEALAKHSLDVSRLARSQSRLASDLRRRHLPRQPRV
jgi:Nuclease-related domain